MTKRQLQIGKSFGVLIGLLRARKTFIEEIRQGVGLDNKIFSLLIASSTFFAVYGAIIGASDRYHSFLQAMSSAVKLPALYLMTLGICFPTLYFFSILFGDKKSFGQYLALLMAAVSVISVLLFAFAPVTLFFLITAYNYQFFKLLNVAIFALTGFFGISLFYEGMQYMAEQDTDEGQANRSKLLKFWLVLYAVVGTQLGWTLRPFFGAMTNEKFVLFRQMEGNFYFNILEAIRHILGFK
jgi:hypothetical protein